MNRAAPTLAALLAGAVTAAVTWVVLVPWDLSESDASGAVEGGGDANAGAIAIVAGVLLAIGLLLALVRQTSRHAAAFTFGAFATWAVLFAWRAGTAEVSGANLFMIPLLFAVIPTALIAPLIIYAVARARTSRP